MEIVSLVLLVLFSVVGFGAIFFTTFGTLIILIGAVLYSLLTQLLVLPFKTLLILFLLYLIGEVMEYLLIIMGAKRLGASNAAVVGALVGGIVGAILGVGVLGVGLFIGTFLGIFLGAFLVEFLLQRDLVNSLKAGLGGVLGRLGSIVAKVVIAAIMFFIIISSLLRAGVS